MENKTQDSTHEATVQPQEAQLETKEIQPPQQKSLIPLLIEDASNDTKEEKSEDAPLNVKCICGETMKYDDAFNHYDAGIAYCDSCRRHINTDFFYHCPRNNIPDFHLNGYDYCNKCAKLISQGKVVIDPNKTEEEKEKEVERKNDEEGLRLVNEMTKYEGLLMGHVLRDKMINIKDGLLQAIKKELTTDKYKDDTSLRRVYAHMLHHTFGDLEKAVSEYEKIIELAFKQSNPDPVSVQKKFNFLTEYAGALRDYHKHEKSKEAFKRAFTFYENEQLREKMMVKKMK